MPIKEAVDELESTARRASVPAMLVRGERGGVGVGGGSAHRHLAVPPRPRLAVLAALDEDDDRAL